MKPIKVFICFSYLLLISISSAEEISVKQIPSLDERIANYNNGVKDNKVYPSTDLPKPSQVLQTDIPNQQQPPDQPLTVKTADPELLKRVAQWKANQQLQSEQLEKIDPKDMTMPELYQALINADKVGDTARAKMLSKYILDNTKLDVDNKQVTVDKDLEKEYQEALKQQDTELMKKYLLWVFMGITSLFIGRFLLIKGWAFLLNRIREISNAIRGQ